MEEVFKGEQAEPSGHRAERTVTTNPIRNVIKGYMTGHGAPEAFSLCGQFCSDILTGDLGFCYY